MITPTCSLVFRFLLGFLQCCCQPRRLLAAPHVTKLRRFAHGSLANADCQHGLDSVHGIVASIVETVASNIEVVEDPCQLGGVQLATPHAIHRRGVLRFKQILKLHGIKAKILEVPDVSKRVVAKEDDVPPVIQIRFPRQIQTTIHTVCLMSTERRREAGCNMHGRLSQRYDCRFAKIKAIRASLYELGVDQVSILSDTEVVGADEISPVRAVGTRGNIGQLPRV